VFVPVIVLQSNFFASLILLLNIPNHPSNNESRINIQRVVLNKKPPACPKTYESHAPVTLEVSSSMDALSMIENTL
jgi:hypothetical protein